MDKTKEVCSDERDIMQVLLTLLRDEFVGNVEAKGTTIELRLLDDRVTGLF